MIYSSVLPKYSHNRVHQTAFLDFYSNLFPMSKVYLDTNVSVQSIKDYIHIQGIEGKYNTDYDGMTPLHILALNPMLMMGSILASGEVNTSAAFVRDGSGKAPLDTLLQFEDLNSFIVLIPALCTWLVCM